jgi:tetratricopeptide (TPR) repeat protein
MDWTRLSLLAVLISVAGCGPPGGGTVVRMIDGRPQASRYVSPGAYQHYIKAQVLLDREQLRQAAEELERALMFDPRSPYLHTRLAEVQARLGDDSGALDHLGRALKRRPGFADALLLRGKVLWRLEQRVQARAALQRCVELNPRHVPCHLALVALLERSGQQRQARPLLLGLLRRVPDSRDAHRRLARVCLGQVDYACVARHLGLALQQGWDLETLMELAHAHRALGHRERTAHLLREAFDRSGGSLQVAAPLLEALELLGKHQAMDDLLQLLERAAWGAEDKLLQLLELALHVRRPAFAGALARRLMSGTSGRDNPLLLVLRAEAQIQQGRSVRGQALVRGLLKRKLDERSALRLAGVLERQGMHAESARMLGQAIARLGQRPELVLARSRALLMQGRHREAEQVLSRAMAELGPRRQLQLALAVALERAGKWREAIRLMQRRLKQKPDDAGAHNFIGFTLVVHGGDLGLAERHLRAALFLQPGQGHIIDSLGWLTYRQGHPARARTLLQVALRLSPRDPEVLEHLARVNAALKQPDRAVRLLRQAAAESTDPRITERVKRRLGELERARVGNARGAGD